MAPWIRVAEAGEIPPGAGRSVSAGARRVAVFNAGGELFAIDDACPHQGASLGQGALDAGRVVCPLHAWVFDLRTGRCPHDSHEPVATYPVRCSAGAIEVHLPADA
jgi:NAD(P)H-dependent nitrite reductase small subunit